MTWLMDPVDSELPLGKESGLPIQRVSTQIASVIVHDHPKCLWETTQQHIKGGARTFILRHDGKHPADAMMTEA